MRKIILLNHVNSDGIGDFHHFLEIYQALICLEKSRSFEFISVICCLEPRVVPRIKNAFTAVNRGQFFIGVPDDFSKAPLQPLLQAEFNLAVQIIQISYAEPFIFRRHYQLPEKVLLKFIGEHECGGRYVEDKHPFATFSGSGSLHIGSMGLSEKHVGIKIKERSALAIKPRNELFEDIILTESEQAFQRALLTYTLSVDVADFNRKNYLYPTYFNRNHNLVRFLLLLSMHVSKQSQPKDIAIYLSGQDLLLEELRSFAFDITFFSQLPVKQIIFIEANGTCSCRVFNERYGQSIRIFHGFYLEDQLYQAIYQQAPMVGVSGDNTFEKAVSLGVLPFYCSTNAVMKNPTLLAMAQIIRDKMNFLPIKIQEDFICYFQKFYGFISFNGAGRRLQFEFEQSRTAFAALDLEGMMKYWPRVAAYLFEHHNFYSRLEEIVFTGIDLSQQDLPAVSPPMTTNTSEPEQIVPSTIHIDPELPKLPSSPNKWSSISMEVLSGFMLIVGAAAVAISFTLLNAATFGLALVVAGVGVAMLLGGIGIFTKGCERHSSERDSTGVNRMAR